MEFQAVAGPNIPDRIDQSVDRILTAIEDQLATRRTTRPDAEGMDVRRQLVVDTFRQSLRLYRQGQRAKALEGFAAVANSGMLTPSARAMVESHLMDAGRGSPDVAAPQAVESAVAAGGPEDRYRRAVPSLVEPSPAFETASAEPMQADLRTAAYNADEPSAEIMATRPHRSPTVLGPGDVIAIKFFYTPELDVTQPIRPDGRITLQLVGEVVAEGKTPAQLRDELVRRYGKDLRNPHITVVVQSLYERHIYVAGQVMEPGIVQMPAEMTVMEAIMSAGGFDLREAELETVLVIRREGGRWKADSLDMKSIISRRTDSADLAESYPLRPRDIVYVPRTKIAESGQWVEQHINRLIPRLPFYFTLPITDL